MTGAGSHAAAVMSFCRAPRVRYPVASSMALNVSSVRTSWNIAWPMQSTPAGVQGAASP